LVPVTLPDRLATGSEADEDMTAELLRGKQWSRRERPLVQTQTQTIVYRKLTNQKYKQQTIITAHSQQSIVAITFISVV